MLQYIRANPEFPSLVVWPLFLNMAEKSIYSFIYSFTFQTKKSVSPVLLSSVIPYFFSEKWLPWSLVRHALWLWCYPSKSNSNCRAYQFVSFNLTPLIKFYVYHFRLILIFKLSIITVITGHVINGYSYLHFCNKWFI